MNLRPCGIGLFASVVRLPLFAALSALLAVPALSQPPPLRIMPLGDSITYGSNNDGIGGGYRYPLYVALTNAGYNVDYVGTQTTIPHVGLGAEINHQGHSGWHVSAASDGLYENILTWLSQIDAPDVVLVHIGTNDTGDTPNFPGTINELDALITRIAAARPYAHIIVTTLLKRGTDDLDSRYVLINTYFNPYVEGVVQAHKQAGRRVHFLDMHAHLERTDMYDNLHPNNAGYGKMAAAWFPAVTNIVTPYGDFVPPTVAGVRTASATTLTVTFSKPIDLAASPDVATPASWSVSPAGSVTAVSALSSDKRSITLTVAGLSPTAISTLSLNGSVTDLVPASSGGPFTTSLSGAVGSFVASGARAWTGLGSDALWSTAANWTGTAVPTSSETVYFTGDGNSKTAVTLGSGATAAGLTFVPDAAAYTLGLPGETLTLSANAAVTLSAGSANSQTVAASLLVAGNLNVYNYEPSKTLTLSYTNTANREIYLRGTGPITFNTLQRSPAQEETDTNYIRLETRISAPLTFTDRMSFGALWSYDNPLNLTFAPNTTNVSCRNDWNFAINVGGAFNGEGAALRIVPSDPARRARIAIQTYRVNMNVQLIAPKGFETTGGWTRGTLVLNHPDNDIQGTLALDRGNGVEVAFLSPNGTPNPLGSCTTVNFVNPLDSGVYARLRVTGSGASSSDKAFTVDKDRAVIENAGIGTLALTGPFTGAGTFVFDAFGDITLSGSRSGTGGLAKTGTGTLTLTAANSHSGTNFIEGGTLALPAGASLGSGPVFLAGGTLALNPAAADSYTASIPAVTLTAASMLNVPDAATASSVTLASLTRNGNTLSINAPSAGTAANRIFITGLANGPASGIILNGGPATYNSGTGLAPLSLPAAAIINDTLPDSAGSAATATAAPATSFSIAQPLTTLGQFSYTADAPATLDLGGRILALDYLNTSPSALAVINGTLTASGAIPNIDYPGLRTVNIVPLTSDAATGLSTSKTYSHLLDFGNQGAATINGVAFTLGAANGTGTGYSGFPNGNNYSSWNSWTNTLPPETCAGLRALLYDMNYAGNWTGQLTGLTPGAIYEVTLYFRAWDAPPSTQERRSLYQFYSASSSYPDTSVIYASQPNSANALVYRYMAPASGTLKIGVTAVATSGNVASGCFGLSNERLAAAAGTPPASGSLALSGPLSVSASLVDNGTPTALTVAGADPVTLSGPVSLAGPVRIDAPLTLAPSAAVTQAFNGPISGNAPLTLSGGTGRVILNTANPALTGPVNVSSGILEIAHSQSLGASAQPGPTVADGGSLAIGQAANNTVVLAKTVSIAGNGPDGLGALRFDYDALQYSALTSVALTDDASVGGTGPTPLPYNGTRGRFDIRNGTLDFGGHTLSKVGSSSFVITSTKATGVTSGTGLSVQNGVLGLEASTDLGGSSANTASVAAGSGLDLYNLTLPVNWTLALADGARLSVRSGNTNQNFWAGPVTLTGGQAILDGQTSYAHHNITGEISGSGGLLKAFGGYTYLRNPANTFSGAISVTNSLLHAYAPGSVPSAPASLTVSGTGEFVARAASDGWTTAQIESLASSGAFQSRTAYLGIDTADADLTYSANWPATGIAKLGPYALAPTGDWPATGPIRVHDGTLNLNAMNGGTLNLGAYGVQVGFDNWAASCGLLPLSGNTAITTVDNGYNRSQPAIGVGTLGSSRGVLTIGDNAFIQGRLHVGRDGTSAGAVYQTGGVFLNTGGAAADGRIGESGFGYYEISGGSLTNKGYTQLSHNTSAYGILRVKGEGRVVFNSGSVPAQGTGGDNPAAYYGGTLGTRAGYGHFHASGNGTVDTGLANLELGMWTDVNSYNNGWGFLTLEENARVSANAVTLANRNSAPLAVVTLKGGTLDTKYLQKGGNNAAGNTAQAAVNFDGGTLSVRESGSAVRTGANNAPAILTVHSGGAVIDTPAGVNATLDLPLAPAKTGVGFIEVNAQGSGYIAPPAVLITGGGGTGAVAEAVLNNGAVTGIRMLSPGTGYTALPTVTLNGGGPLSAASIRTSALGAPDASDGGLTKTGPGTLTLNVANTYRGPTTVADGTLVPAAEGSLPPGSDLVLSGGILALGTRAHTNFSTRVSGSGALAGGSLATVALVKEGEGTFDLSTRVAPRAAELAAAIRAAKVPGLREYRLNGSSTLTNGVETAATGPTVQLSTRALLGSASSSSGGATLNGAWWPDNSVYVYTGYLWNNEPTNVTWTFMQNMDDTFLMRLDGNVILNKGFTTILPYRVTGNAGTHCTVTLSPGPHAIEIRAGQGGGGVGGYWTKSDGSRPVWGIDRLARDTANVEYCEFITDPSDGSLFTVNNPYDDLGIAFSPVSTVVPTLPADVASGVGDLAKGFSVVYAGTVPVLSDTILNDSFWSVKNLGSSNRFDRVAYVLALEHPTYGRQWVWASFEPPFTDRTKLAFPITSKRMCFQKRVNRLTVRASANANVTPVDDVDTGNIEWYPNDYNLALPDVNAFDRGYVGDGAKYDFDDRNSGNDGTFYGNAAGYGSFQVHNFGLNQTLFAINHFGRTSYKPCIGIGNKPGDAVNLDWTFTENADAYTVRELYILTRDVAPVTEPTPAVQINEGTLRVVDAGGTMPVPADIRAKVGALADGYDTVYYSPVSTTAAAAYNGTAYAIDNSAATAPFDRVAYFLEIRKTGETQTQWVWVSFNAHTQDRTKLGYPNRNGATFMWQQKVYNMDVRSNVGTVTDATGVDTGNLEIWPSNYGTGLGLADIGGNASAFDFNDNGANTSIGHGSFQIHNWGAEQVLFSVSHCGSSGNGLGLGIGNDPNPPTGQTLAYDYTWTYNAGTFDIRNLYVFVRPAIAPEDIGNLLADADINLAAGAVLDLNASTQTVRSVSGAGTIANGILAAGTVLSPAGDGVVGTLALSGVTFVPGIQYRADLGDLLDVTGSLDITGLVLHLNNPEALVRSQTYTLIQTTGEITGVPTSDQPLPDGWKAVIRGNALQLLSLNGTVIILK